MVKIYKTNIKDSKIAELIRKNVLQKCFPKCKINFDLEDCDKILRISGDNISSEIIYDKVRGLGYYCIEIH